MKNSRVLVAIITNEIKGLKIINIDLEMNDAPLIPNGRPRMLWDHDNIPSNGLRSSCIDIAETETIFRSNARFRPARYLSLIGIHSLTMFCCIRAVSCIQADDDSTKRLGIPYEKNCSVTYFLRPGEFIQSLHIVTVGPKKDGNLTQLLNGPYILVRKHFSTTATTTNII